MNTHISTGTKITTGRRKPSEIVVEYEGKRETLADAFATIGGNIGSQN